MFKKFLTILTAFAMVFALASCGGGSSSSAPASGSGTAASGATSGTDTASGDKYIVKMGTVISENHASWPALVEFKGAVETAAGGRIEVQLYPNGQLGGEREMVEATIMGTLEMFYGGSMTLGNFTNKVKFWGLPFLFSSGFDALFEFFDIYGDEIQQGVYEDTGTWCIWALNGAFNPANGKRPILTPDDMKGLKFRCHEIDTFIKGYEALGASAVPMAFTEIYTALQQGTIEGTHTNNLLLYDAKFYEVCKYYSPMNLSIDMSIIQIGGEWYDSLPDDLQTVIWDNAQILAKRSDEIVLASGAEVDAALQDGLVEYTTYTAETLQPFIDAAQPVYDWFASTGQEPNLEQYLATAKELNDKYMQ